MAQGFVLLEGEKLPVHVFLDRQKEFINDMEIVCHGFQNILDHEIKQSDNFIQNLWLLYKKVTVRYHLSCELSDKIVWKREVQRKLSHILKSISAMMPEVSKK